MYNTGSILFKYGDGDFDDDDADIESRFVGIGFSIEKRSGLNFFRIDKAAEHHIRKGRILIFIDIYDYAFIIR